MRYCWLLFVFLFSGNTSVAETVDYARDVKPLLRGRCFACHGALKQEGGLRLDSGESIARGGDSGPAVAPGQAAASLLVQRITAEESTRMPAGEPPLAAAEIALLTDWIGQGAVVPAGDAAESDPREHWAFKLPAKQPLPVSDSAWMGNPIDAWIAHAQHERGLAPSQPAHKAALLRRVSMDLIGLPPTVEELRAFLADGSADAYEREVDRLLDSPHHGERWARHWMDVWRYSDWYGRRYVPDVWNSAPQVWRWRDWLARSLVADKGYDRLLQEMLAADEVAPGDGEAAVATGYLVRNWYALNPNQWMRDNVEHTAKAFLGLTLNCCHCHDHKYDPISQEEYFRFRSFFEPLGVRQDRWPGESDPGPFQKYDYSVLRKVQRLGSVSVLDEHPQAPTVMYSLGDERQPIAGKPPVLPGAPAFLGGKLAVEPLELPVEAWYPGLKPFVQHEEALLRQQAIVAVEAELTAARAAAPAADPALDAAVLAAEGQLALARQTAIGSGALFGQQSLLLDAVTGRRTLANALPGLGSLADGALVAWQLAILDDGHTNFQLGLNIAQGATGAFVAFDNGAIKSYRPGGFEEFEAGRYDVAAGQSRFAVQLALDFPHNQALLTVRTQPTDAANATAAVTLVDAVAVAINGWNPPQAAPAQQGIFLDARPGTAAVYDEITFGPAGGEPQLRFGFEAPEYVAGQDVIGGPGWSEPPFSQPPAISRVSNTATLDPTVRAAERQLLEVQRRRRAPQAGVLAAEAKLAAATADLASVGARIAADNARYRQPGGDADALAAAASLAERQYNLLAAQAALAGAEKSLAAAEALAADAADRAAMLQMAAAQQTAALTSLSAAQQALTHQSSSYTPLSPQYAPTSTGRRRALAMWLTSRENPLTARVAVNHLWRWHFERPLVATVFDFGRNGASPTHPELLDWLAVELMENNWSLKHLNRLIVTSNTYRQQSSSQEASGPAEAAKASIAADPANAWLWRFPSRRLEAEAIRDSVLATAGELDVALGGPSIERSQENISRRRSLYFEVFPEETGHLQFLEMFDPPDACDCYKRTATIVPQQSLAMTNSRLVLNSSRLLAGKLTKQIDALEPAAHDTVLIDTVFIDAAFEAVLSRQPSEVERAACLAFLARQQAALAAADPAALSTAGPEGQVAPSADLAQRARESLVRALYNHDDFVTVR